MATAAVNTFEYAARLKKAYGLAVTLFRMDATPEFAEKLNDHEWSLVAQLAKVKPPSGETKRVAIEKLRGLWKPIGERVHEDF